MKTKTVQARHGEFRYFADDSYIGKSLEKYGEYSEGEVDIFRRFVKPESTVIEVGANIGVFTVPLAKMAAHVIAFEPQPQTAKLLRANLAANLAANLGEPTKVIVIEGAVGAKKHLTMIPALESLGHKNFGAVEIGAGGLSAVVVPVVTIDSVDVTKIDFIKIDAEGSEFDVIEGARQTIERDHPVMYVENDRKEKSERLIRQLQDMGYWLYWHKPPIYRQDNFFGVAGDIFHGCVSINMLCLHESMDYVFVDGYVGLDFIPNAPGRFEASRIPIGSRKYAGIVRLGGVGDCLVAASACRPLKAQGYWVEFICQEPHEVVLQNNPFIDRLIVKTAADLQFPDMNQWQGWFANRAKEYDLFVNLSHSMEALLAPFAGMTNFWWSADARHKLCDKNYLEVAHDIVGVPYDFGPLFFPTDEEKAKASEKKAEVQAGGDAPVIGWLLSGTRYDKMYPHAAFAIARIIREVGASVVMLGPSKDFEMAKTIHQQVAKQNGDDKGLFLAMTATEGGWPNKEPPKWHVRRTLAFAQACDLVISPDTGPAWACAFEAMPKIVLTSHASPTNIVKHWNRTIALHGDPERVKCQHQGKHKGCHRLHDSPATCCENHDKTGAACISDISVECLITAVRAMMGNGAAAKHLRDTWPGNVTPAASLTEER